MAPFDFRHYGELYRAQLQALSDARAANDEAGIRRANHECALLIREMVRAYQDHVEERKNEQTNR